MRRLAAVVILLGLLAVPVLHASAGKGRLRHGTVGVVVQPPPPVPTADCPPSGANTSLVRYVAPGATGNGLAVGAPMSMSAALSAATTGYTIVMASGTYTQGNGGLLRPPSGRTGVTVCAADESNPPLLDGGFTADPIQLNGNDFWVLQGINAKSGSAAAMQLRAGSSNNVVRRVVVWDSNIQVNGVVIQVTDDSFDNLLEDVAAFGTGRSTISVSQGGDRTTMRRVWARFEGSTNVGGKNTYQLAYNTYDAKCENCIGQFSGVSMPQTYTLMNNGTTWTGAGAGTYTNFSIQQPEQIFHAVTIDNANKCVNLQLLGSFAYALSTDRFQGTYATLLTQLDCMTAQDVVATFASNWTTKRGFFLGAGATGTGLVANRITTIGGSGNDINGQWSQTAIAYSPTLAGVPNPFTTATGANLCFRYLNGVRTTQPLWPWPMDARIVAAVNSAGTYAGPCDQCSGGRLTRVGTIPSGGVTEMTQGLLGTIPAQCRA